MLPAAGGPHPPSFGECGVVDFALAFIFETYETLKL
jgi:hypothetical protein